MIILSWDGKCPTDRICRSSKILPPSAHHSTELNETFIVYSICNQKVEYKFIELYDTKQTQEKSIIADRSDSWRGIAQELTIGLLFLYKIHTAAPYM